MQKLLFFSFFLISLQTQAEAPHIQRSTFGTLIKTRDEVRSVLVSNFKFRAHPESWCIEYEDGNSYDGACIKERSRCYFEARRTATAFLGHDEVYEFFEPTPAFPGLDGLDAANCDERVKKWAREHANNVVTYRFHEDLFHSIYVNNVKDENGFICYDTYITNGYAFFGTSKQFLQTEGKRVPRPEDWATCFDLSQKEHELPSPLRN
jgi:hypothetical protein